MIGHTQSWGPSRYGALLAVSLMHIGMIILILLGSGAPARDPQPPRAVEVSFLPPPQIPRIRSNRPPSPHISWGTTISPTLPQFEAPMDGESPRAAATGDGTGMGIDWAAEARRALHAYEIRSHLPPSNHSASGDQVDVWLRQAHHGGDRMRTAAGDWIIWIDTKCYQVAGAGQDGSIGPKMTPPVICQDPAGGVAGP